MPMVGGKEYPYTAKGIAAAKKAAESKEDKNKRNTKNMNTKIQFGGYNFTDVKTGASRKKLPGDTAEKKRMMSKTALKNKLSKMGKSAGK